MSVKLLLFRIIHRFSVLKEQIYDCYYKSLCIVGENSFFHKEACVINMQNCDKIRIGKGTHIRGELCVLPYGQGLNIGNNSYVGGDCIIRAYDHISIGDNVLIAHNVTIIDSDSHEIDAKERVLSYVQMLKNGHPNSHGNVMTAPITIKDYAWISYNVCILKGVTIGEGAIVGAGSVVTKDVPDWTVVAGNPAKIIRHIK